VADPLIEHITPPNNWYVVLRPFNGEGDYRFVRGEVVDTAEWRRVPSLIENRYIQVLPYGAEVPEPDAEGRRVLVVAEDGSVPVPEKKMPAKRAATKKQAASS
jgi:hypothetical protein